MGILSQLSGMPSMDTERRPGSFLMDLVAAAPQPRQVRDVSRETSAMPSADGLHPLLAKLQNRLPWLDLSSGFRSPEDQQRLWQEALAKYGDPEIADNWVARPGTSNHERGLAIDVSRDDIDRLVAWLSKHPRFGSQIGRPMSHEPWHFEVGG